MAGLWRDFGATLARLWRDSGATLARLWRDFGATLAQGCCHPHDQKVEQQIYSTSKLYSTARYISIEENIIHPGREVHTSFQICLARILVFPTQSYNLVLLPLFSEKSKIMINQI